MSKWAFLDHMTHVELAQVLSLYFPKIKLGSRTYSIGLKRHAVLPTNERLFFKTLEGYISLDVVIGFDSLNECPDTKLYSEVSKVVNKYEKSQELN